MEFSLFFCLGYEPPHRNEVQRELKRLYSVHLSRLHNTLKTVKSIALTSDYWSDRHQNSFFCITGHFLDDDIKLHSTILHFQSFTQRHVSSNIALEIQTCLHALGIKNKVTSVTCDGATNMRNAFDMLTNINRLWCVAHRIHLTVCNGLFLWKKSKKIHNESNRNDLHADDSIDIQTPLDEDALQNISDDKSEYDSSAGNSLNQGCSEGEENRLIM